MKNTLSKSSWGLFWFFVLKEKYKISFLILISFFSGAIPSIDSFLLKKIIDLIESYYDAEAKKLPSILFYWALGYALWWEFINFTWRCYDYIYMKSMPKVEGKIIDEFFNYTQFHSHKFFQENLAGQITSRITEASRSFEIVFALLNEKMIHKIAMIFFALATVFHVHPSLAAIFLLWILIFISINVFFSKQINQYSITYARNRGILAGKIVDSIANIGAVRMFSSHKFERNYVGKFIDKSVESDIDMQWFMFKLRYVLGFSCSVMIFSMIYYLVFLRSRLFITIGDCVLVISLCLAVADSIWDLTQEVGDFFEELGTFNQSLTLLVPYTILDKKGAKDIKIQKADIEFKKISFGYSNSSNKIFQDLSIFLKHNQKIGLVGFSGSGKTSFVNLINRIYDVESGEILIDNQNIQNVTQDSLRNNISVIPQEPILFHRTVLENIRYGKKDATYEEIVEAAKLAHIHDVILNLSEGYNSLCGERGNNFSGGQRQRIIIARAIIKNAPILILDEATSSLDSKTEELIQNSLNYLMKNKTVLVIAHRLSTLLNMDRILVFNQGQIVADGSHAELLASSELYQRLWQSQIKGFIKDTE